jgi:hypothetical protein
MTKEEPLLLTAALMLEGKMQGEHSQNARGNDLTLPC